MGATELPGGRAAVLALPTFRDALTIWRKPAIKTATGRAYLARLLTKRG